MKIKQLIGLLILIVLFTLLGAVTKDLTYWSDWFVSWGVVFGVLITIVVGMFMLLDRDPKDNIL